MIRTEISQRTRQAIVPPNSRWDRTGSWRSADQSADRTQAAQVSSISSHRLLLSQAGISCAAKVISS